MHLVIVALAIITYLPYLPSHGTFSARSVYFSERSGLMISRE